MITPDPGAPPDEPVRSAIDRAVSFLQRRQLAWGEFAGYRFTDAALAGPGQLDSSPFVSTFVLHALDFVDNDMVDSMRRRALAFLLEEREDPGIWRYWSSRQGTPIDPDLDDTCCASFALTAHGLGAASNGDNRAYILQNRHESGLFKTWLRDASADNDVDGVVNANVLLYLGERPETQAARNIVTGAINAGREEAATWYYLDPLALYYMVARAFHHGITGFSACRDTVLRNIEARRASGDLDALTTALALSARAHYGASWSADDDRQAASLLAAQRPDGSWPRAAFYRGPEPPTPHRVWWGSEELTTAFCVEALARSPFYRRANDDDAW